MIKDLRLQYKKETGTPWENFQGEPDIDYVLWLENIIWEQKYEVEQLNKMWQEACNAAGELEKRVKDAEGEIKNLSNYGL